jgi:lipopolysaccharide transport system permease protein
LTVGMFATSVLYPADLVKGTLATVMRLNPMTPIIDAYRDVLIFGRFPQTTPFLIAVGFSALTLFLGWLLFHRAEFEFAENV